MTTEKATTMEVIIHKAKIALVGGETLGDYTRKLSNAGREHVISKLNIPKNTGGAWMMEAYSDKAIFAAYKGDETNRYYAFKYTRKKDGTFDLGGIVEVERVTTFKPKEGMTITKGKKAKKEEEEKGCSDGVKKELQRFGDWRQTTKSFWMGVV